MTITKRTYSTGEVARICETDRQTILAWDRRGVLSPSKRARGERRYTVRDLVAALIARTSREIGLPPYAVNRMVVLVQEGDERKLKLARVATYRSETPGMMRHIFIDVDDKAERKALQSALRRDREREPEKREVISHARLHEMFKAVLLQVHERHLQDRMAATKNEAN